MSQDLEDEDKETLRADADREDPLEDGVRVLEE